MYCPLAKKPKRKYLNDINKLTANSKYCRKRYLQLSEEVFCNIGSRLSVSFKFYTGDFLQYCNKKNTRPNSMFCEPWR